MFPKAAYIYYIIIFSYLISLLKRSFTDSNIQSIRTRSTFVRVYVLPDLHRTVKQLWYPLN